MKSITWTLELGSTVAYTLRLIIMLIVLAPTWRSRDPTDVRQRHTGTCTSQVAHGVIEIVVKAFLLDGVRLFAGERETQHSYLQPQLVQDGIRSVTR